MKRSQQKQITKAAQVLHYMRIAKGISAKVAGEICGCSGSAIMHYENGRMTVAPARIEQLVNAYEYTMKDFEGLLQGSIPTVSMKKECVELLDRLNEIQIGAVHTVLKSYIHS